MEYRWTGVPNSCWVHSIVWKIPDLEQELAPMNRPFLATFNFLKFPKLHQRHAPNSFIKFIVLKNQLRNKPWINLICIFMELILSKRVSKRGLSFVLFMSCVCHALLPCGHLKGKFWPLGSCLWCCLWFCYFPISILVQVWYLIVSIPDPFCLSYFNSVR